MRAVFADGSRPAPAAVHLETIPFHMQPLHHGQHPGLLFMVWVSFEDPRCGTSWVRLRETGAWDTTVYRGWNHRAGRTKTRFALPGRRREASPRKAHFAKDVPSETLLKAIRWSVVFGVFGSWQPGSPWIWQSQCVPRSHQGLLPIRVSVGHDPGMDADAKPITDTIKLFFLCAGFPVARREHPGTMRCWWWVCGRSFFSWFRRLAETRGCRPPLANHESCHIGPAPGPPNTMQNFCVQFFRLRFLTGAPVFLAPLPLLTPPPSHLSLGLTNPILYTP